MTEKDTQVIKNLIIESRSTSVGRLAEIAVELSSYFATLGEELENIEVFYASRWLDIRKGATSDKMADKLWDATKEGQLRTGLRLKLKFMEKIISSIKLRLKIKEGESFGRY